MAALSKLRQTHSRRSDPKATGTPELADTGDAVVGIRTEAPNAEE
jgi:hypothetical protein